MTTVVARSKAGSLATLPGYGLPSPLHWMVFSDRKQGTGLTGLDVIPRHVHCPAYSEARSVSGLLSFQITDLSSRDASAKSLLPIRTAFLVQDIRQLARASNSTTLQLQIPHL